MRTIPFRTRCCSALFSDNCSWLSAPIFTSDHESSASSGVHMMGPVASRGLEYVCICIWACIYIYIFRVYRCICIYLCTYVYVCMIHTYICMYDSFIHTYVYIYVCVLSGFWLYMCLRAFAYTGTNNYGWGKPWSLTKYPDKNIHIRHMLAYSRTHADVTVHVRQLLKYMRAYTVDAVLYIHIPTYIHDHQLLQLCMYVCMYVCMNVQTCVHTLWMRAP